MKNTLIHMEQIENTDDAREGIVVEGAGWCVIAC